ncbi:hypothetical protein Q3G72_010195 [Acer saccharum]|nr:hypothetical protein Q3G72_010195 [Acer saccharum]
MSWLPVVWVYFLAEDWFLPSLDLGVDPAYWEDRVLLCEACPRELDSGSNDIFHYFYTWMRFDFELHKATNKFWDKIVGQEEDQDNHSHLGQLCMGLEDDYKQEYMEGHMGREDNDQSKGLEDGDDVEYQEDD